METPSRVLSKRKSSNTIKKQVEVGEKGEFKKTAAATSKILEAAEIALKALEYMLEKPNESVGIVSMNLKQS